MTVQKASGEPAVESSYFLKVQSVTLFLSYSAYKLSISALNKAGQSPAGFLDVDALVDQNGGSSKKFVGNTKKIFMIIYLFYSRTF